MGNKEKEDRFRSLLVSYGKGNLDELEYEDLVAHSVISREHMQNHLDRLLLKVGSRETRIALMARSRLLIARLYTLTGQNSRSYLTLKQAILNFSAYSANRRMVENGTDPDGGLAPAAPEAGKDAKKGAKEEKKDAKKGAKGGSADDDLKKQQEEQKIIETEQVYQPKLRSHPNHLLPLKLRVELGMLLYRQNNLQDLGALIGQV